MDFKKILSDARLKSQKTEALAEPSVMDDYLKQNDPSQYQEIEKARTIVGASDPSNYNAIGTITDPKEIAHVINKIKGGYTKDNVLKALEFDPIERIQDVVRSRKSLRGLLDHSLKERLGNISNVNEEHLVQDTLDKFYPEIKKTGLPVSINPNLSNYGAYTKRGFPAIKGSQRPVGIKLQEPSVSVAAHEAQHFRDNLVNPFYNSFDELVPGNADFMDLYSDTVGSQRSGFLRDKLKYLNPNINQKETLGEINDLMKNSSQRKFGRDFMEKYLNKPDSNINEFISGGHFYQYPKNFELDKSLELLNNKMVTPNLKELVDNKKIIDSISSSLDNRSVSYSDSKKIQDEILKEYEKANFPNLKKFLEE
jgi:hypothetical protein